MSDVDIQKKDGKVVMNINGVESKYDDMAGAIEALNRMDKEGRL